MRPFSAGQPAARAQKKHLRASAINRRVALLRRLTVDELGQLLDIWTEYARVWGAVLQLNGKEHLGASTTVSIGNASIRIRYRTDVLPGDRAVCEGVMFRVVTVLPNVASREYTDLVVTGVSSDG